MEVYASLFPLPSGPDLPGTVGYTTLFPPLAPLFPRSLTSPEWSRLATPKFSFYFLPLTLPRSLSPLFFTKAAFFVSIDVLSPSSQLLLHAALFDLLSEALGMVLVQHIALFPFSLPFPGKEDACFFADLRKKFSSRVFRRR